MTNAEREEGMAQMIAILEEHGIEMNVGGCGCCGSPWVKFSYRGEVVFDDDGAGFSTTNG